MRRPPTRPEIIARLIFRRRRSLEVDRLGRILSGLSAFRTLARNGVLGGWRPRVQGGIVKEHKATSGQLHRPIEKFQPKSG
jgi:hypothetical protein